MIIPMELPAGYILMSSPDDKTFLLAFEVKGEQKLEEIHYFEYMPDLAEINEVIADQNCAKIPNKK